MDHVEATNEFLHSALGLKLPRLREQDHKELSLLFKAVQPAMLDALSAYICDFQLEGLVAADLVLAGFIRGGAPNRVYVPMIPKMDNNAALPPVFTERLRFTSQSPLNSNCITVETFSKALGECVKVGAFTNSSIGVVTILSVLWTYVNQRDRLVFRSYLQAAPNNGLQKAPLMETLTFGPDRNVTVSSAHSKQSSIGYWGS